MEKEFNLSEKRYEGSEIVAMTFNGLYKEEDVKEFIRILKKEIGWKTSDRIEIELKEVIDKIAGDELLK